MGHHWQVWHEENETMYDGDNPPTVRTLDVTEFEGSHDKCLTYYKRHGGAKAGLHIGYETEPTEED